LLVAIKVVISSTVACNLTPNTESGEKSNILREARVACTMRATRGHAEHALNPRACGREGGNLAIFASASSALARHSSIVDMACSNRGTCKALNYIKNRNLKKKGGVASV
jgi:hypothetical protein